MQPPKAWWCAATVASGFIRCFYADCFVLTNASGFSQSFSPKVLERSTIRCFLSSSEIANRDNEDFAGPDCGVPCSEKTLTCAGQRILPSFIPTDVPLCVQRALIA